MRLTSNDQLGYTFVMMARYQRYCYLFKMTGFGHRVIIVYPRSEDVMNVIILGCGRVGSTLASNMFRDGHNVTIVDKRSAAFDRLSQDYKGLTVVGNGTDNEVLRRANIENADAFVAVTNGDNTNIMSVQIAKVTFNVPKVIARIYDPIRAYAYQKLGIDTICTTVIGSGLIYDYLIDKEWGMAADYSRLDDIEKKFTII